MTEAIQDPNRQRSTGELPSGQDLFVDGHMLDPDILLRYSEWLDGEGLIIGDGSPVAGKATPRKLPGEDNRTHSELVDAFLESLEEDGTAVPGESDDDD